MDDVFLFSFLFSIMFLSKLLFVNDGPLFAGINCSDPLCFVFWGYFHRRWIGVCGGRGMEMAGGEGGEG